MTVILCNIFLDYTRAQNQSPAQLGLTKVTN